MDPWPNSIIYLILLGIALIVLIFLSACFSASETAFTSITKFKYDTYYKKKKKGIVYKINLKLLTNYSMTLSTILISNTMSNVASSTISTLFFTDLLKSCDVPNAISVATGLATGIITFLVLIFGEFLPKSIARKYPIQCVSFLGSFIYLLYLLFWPLNWVLNKFVKDENKKSATEQELDTLIDIVSQEGVIESHEASLLSNALKFDERRVASVMSKVDDMITIRYNATQEKIINTFKTSKFSRLPVKKNGKYVGILNLKTYFVNMKPGIKKIKLDKLLDPIIFASQYDTLDKVLQEMQVTQSHFAIIKKKATSSVIVGFLTMENLIEKLVGKIYDENDQFNNITSINDFTWKVLASIKAQEFINKYLKINEEVDEKITVKEWLVKKFKIKRMIDGKEYQNNDLKIIIRNKRNSQLFFIIEKRITSY